MDFYIQAVRQWLGAFFREPQHILAASLFFIVFSLPLVTIGPAAVLTLYLTRLQVEGYEIRYRKLIRQGFRTYFKKSLLLWLTDLIALGLILLSVLTLIAPNTPAPLRFSCAVMGYLDLGYLASALYRYPLLVYNDLPICDTIVRGVLLMLQNLLQTFLVSCIMLIFAVLCFLTGVGLILLLPGGVASLSVFVYKNTLARNRSRYSGKTKEAEG